MKIINFLKWTVKDNTYQDNYLLVAFLLFFLCFCSTLFFGIKALLVGTIAYIVCGVCMAFHSLAKQIKKSWHNYNMEIEKEHQKVANRLAGKTLTVGYPDWARIRLKK